MGETREKVTIEFGADGTKLESGVSGLQRGVARKAEGFAKTFGKNITPAFRDFAEGRVTASMVRFTEALALAGPFAIAAVVGFSAFRQITEHIEEATKAQQKLNKELGAARLAQRGGSVESLVQTREALVKTRDEAEGGMTTGNYWMEKYLNLVGAPVVNKKEMAKEAQSEIYKNTDAITQKMRDQVAVTELLAEGMTREAKAVELTKKYEEQRAAIRAQPYTTATVSQRREQLDAIDAQEKAEKAVIKRQEEIARMEVRTQTHLSTMQGTASDRKIASLKEEHELHIALAEKMGDEIERQKELNKALDIHRSLLEAELAARRESPQARAAERRHERELKQQERIDDLRQRGRMSPRDYQDALLRGDKVTPIVKEKTSSFEMLSTIGEQVSTALAKTLGDRTMVVERK